VFSLYAIGNTLSVNNVFTALSLLNQLRVPLQFLPLVIVFWSQYNVAFTRVRDFALLPELPKHSTTVSSEAKKSNTIVQLKSSIGWEKDKPVLSNVTMKVKRGTVTMIVGSVGSGKVRFRGVCHDTCPF
jgi:ABC-type multidrug transport system fused ATPase/permease subunit